MKRQVMVCMAAIAIGAAGTASAGQIGNLGGALKRVQQARDVEMSESEELQLGTQVSEKIRQRYGVVQSAPVHKYVTLVGSALAQASSKPTLPWKFIVLDTDAVNAFAAPGGFVHITRGALANLKSESELACVLAHEIMHVTERHTVRAIQKGKLVQMGANETAAGNSALMNKLVDKAYEVIESGFGRGEELEADEKGVVLANAVGYAPQGLAGFLSMLVERNKSGADRNGLFASHPETKERIDKVTKQIASQKLTAAATVAPRYASTITFKPVAPAEIATVGGATSGTAATAPPPPADTSKKRGIGGLSSALKSDGSEKKSAQVTGSGAARGGANEDRMAQGGPVKSAVAVTVTAAEVDAFKKAGGLS
jgi:predicted Zn-dependent protease